jgi:Brp/Blh family beta-carotene 15,15'-monooxygenase
MTSLAPSPAHRRGTEPPPLVVELPRGRLGSVPDGDLLHRRVRFAGMGMCALLLAAGLGAPAAVGAVALPLAVAGILAGIPHGAVDHVVPGWVARRPLRPAALAALLAAYLAVAAAGTAAVIWAPTPTVLAFLAVSAWHFGRAEVVVAAQTAGRPVPPAGGDLPLTLAHGLVTTVLPAAAWPAVAVPLLAALAPGLAGLPTAALHAVAVAVVCGAGLVVAYLLARRRPADAVQLALLTATFALVHPFAAFGVYFGGWHALRHTARLVEVAAAGRPMRHGLRRYVTHAAIPTAAAMAFLAVILVGWRGGSRDGASPLLAAELATLLALTFPHAAVVAGMDRTLRLRGRQPDGRA